MRQAGFGVAEAMAAAYQLSEMRGTGYTSTEAKEAGYQLPKILKAGYSCKDAKAAGFTADQCRGAGYTQDEVREAGFGYFDNHNPYAADGAAAMEVHEQQQGLARRRSVSALSDMLGLAESSPDLLAKVNAHASRRRSVR
jgi:hypothetical protein